MKRIVSVICVAFLLVSILSLYAGAVSQPDTGNTRAVDPGRDYVLPYPANLRATGSNTGTILRTVQAGKRVQGVAASNSGWYYTTTAWRNVIYIDTGYIQNDLLIPANKSYVTTANSLNLREQPTTGSNTIISLPKYTRLCYISTATVGNWYRVRAYYNNSEYLGYVSASYVTIDYGS